MLDRLPGDIVHLIFKAAILECEYESAKRFLALAYTCHNTFSIYREKRSFWFSKVKHATLYIVGRKRDYRVHARELYKRQLRALRRLSAEDKVGQYDVWITIINTHIRIERYARYIYTRRAFFSYDRWFHDGQRNAARAVRALLPYLTGESLKSAYAHAACGFSYETLWKDPAASFSRDYDRVRYDYEADLFAYLLLDSPVYLLDKPQLSENDLGPETLPKMLSLAPDEEPSEKLRWFRTYLMKNPLKWKLAGEFLGVWDDEWLEWELYPETNSVRVIQSKYAKYCSWRKSPETLRRRKRILDNWELDDEEMGPDSYWGAFTIKTSFFD